MLNALWLLVPDEALPLLVVGLGIAAIVGLLSLRAAAGWLLLLLAIPMLGPFVETLISELPPWVGLALLVFVALVVLRGVAGAFLGRAAADHMVGSLAADVVRFALVVAFLPVRVLARLVRRIV